jgi:type II secretory pathway component PulM
MKQHSRRARERKWLDSGHASLCLLGSYLRRTGFFQPLEEQMQLQ